MSFASKLVAWYHHAGRHNLPWQINPTPYRVWISEIMLQQTQVATVIPYYENFMSRFPTLKDLAQSDVDDVLAHWAGLGYYTRARNLHKAAMILEHEHQGTFPRTVEGLEALPGIGRSTAGAILSFSMKIPAVILDGNVKRVLTRHFAIEGWPSKTAVHNILWALAEKHTPSINPHYYNQAIMDLGASLCSRSKPQCAHCPFTLTCRAYKTNTVKQFPTSKPKTLKPFPQKDTIMLILINDKHEILLEKRRTQGIWGGLWSFIECDIHTDIKNTCKKLGLRTLQVKKLEAFSHKFSHYQLNIYPRVINAATISTTLSQEKPMQWLEKKEALKLGIPAPISRLLQSLDLQENIFS
jgi:A/G-specific adenine glycosylase